MTKTEELLLEINAHWLEHAESPSIRQLQEKLHLASTNTVYYHIRRLREQGQLLPTDKGQSRAYTPPWVREALLQYKTEKEALAKEERSLRGS